MKNSLFYRVRSLALLLIMLTATAVTNAEMCDSDNIEKDIACLESLGISLDRFTAEYLQWVTDLRSKLKEVMTEEARCSNLRRRYTEDQSLNVLRQIEVRCEGKWLEDRLRRLNTIKSDYIETKKRYAKIREYHQIAKEALELLEGRQKSLEREYEESRQLDR